MSYLLALDQGTTSSRTLLFSLAGEVEASAQKEFTQFYPQPGWVEHDPEEIWVSQLATMREAIGKAGIAPARIAAIGISNQRETTVLWERATGRALGPAIVWQDRRTADYTEALKAEGREPLVREKTGLLLDPYFSASKLRWLLREVEGARVRAERGELCFGTVDSWLMFRLSGGAIHATDVSNASRTLLFNIHSLEWDPELLELFDVPAALLPAVLPSAGRFGTTLPELFGTPIPITGVAGDQQAALFGQGCLSEGMAKATYGTGAFIVMNTGETAVNGEGLLTTIAWQLPGEPARYAMEGSVFIAGAAIQWLRDGLGLIGTTAEVEALARSVADTAGVYFVPALVGLGTPYWDPFARGVITGLTRGTGRAHLVRAALEAMAYQTNDAIEAMERAAGIELRELRVDGGAAANDLLLEFQAGLLSASVVRPDCTEASALGAACLAAVGAGLLDPDQVGRRFRAEKVFLPSMEAGVREELCRGWQRAVRCARLKD